MPREIVDSTVVAAVNYDELRQQLDIELTTGRIYRYLDVPPDVYEAFMAAASKGRYYNDHIRDVYLYERLGRS
jgi:KTSC domain